MHACMHAQTTTQPCPEMQFLQAESGMLRSGSSGMLRVGSSGLLRASSGVKEGVKSALERTSSFKSTISRSSSAGAKELMSALQHTASGDFREASIQVSPPAGGLHVFEAQCHPIFSYPEPFM